MTLIKDGDGLKLNFSLKLTDGSEIDSNFGADPVTMVVGDGSMLPGFEEIVKSLSVGEERTVTLASEQAFGSHLEDNVQRFKTGDFDQSLELETGLVVGFTDAAGGELPGVITDIADDYVEVDFNHPLAGRDIVFRAKLHSID